MKATKLAFERRYSDDSGIEYAVRLDGSKIEFEAVDKVAFPVEEIDWLVGALERIRSELSDGEQP